MSRARWFVAAAIGIVFIGAAVGVIQLINAWRALDSAKSDPYVVSVPIWMPFSMIAVGIIVGIVGVLLGARKRRR